MRVTTKIRTIGTPCSCCGQLFLSEDLTRCPECTINFCRRDFDFRRHGFDGEILNCHNHERAYGPEQIYMLL